MTQPTPRLTPEAPWAGPAAYSEDDAGFFNGRTAEAAEVHGLIRSEPVSLLYGISGIGKTSLLQAGVFPRLRTEGWLPLNIRLDHREKDDDGRLLPSLTAQILHQVKAAAHAGNFTMPDWEAGKDTLAAVFGERGTRLQGVKLVLVFDQFEECWTLTRDRPEARDRVSALLDQMADLTSKPKGGEAPRAGRPGNKEPSPASLRIIFAMRESASADLQILKNRLPDLSRAQFHLLPFGSAQVREVVEMPGGHLFDDGVAAAIFDTLSAQDAARLTVEPTHLSIFFWLLNAERLKNGGTTITTADLDGLIGGTSTGFVRRFYESAFRALPDELASDTRLFVEEVLVDSTGYRTSAPIKTIEEKHGVTAATLDHLLAARLIHHVDRHGGHRHVELVHDRIAVEAVSHRTRRTFHTAKMQERAAELHSIVAANAQRETAEASEREIEDLKKEIESLRGNASGATEAKTDSPASRRHSKGLLAASLLVLGALALGLVLMAKRPTPTQREVEAANKAASAALAEMDLHKNEADKYKAAAKAAEEQNKALGLAFQNSEKHDLFATALIESILSKVAEGVQTQRDRDALKPMLQEVADSLKRTTQSDSPQIQQSQQRILEIIQRINSTIPAPPVPVPPTVTPPVMQPASKKLSQFLDDARKDVQTGKYESGIENCKGAIALLDANRKEDRGDWTLAHTLYATSLVGVARRELDLEHYDSCITKCKDAIALLADPSSKDYWLFWTSAHAIHAEALLERGVNEQPATGQETYLEALKIVERGLASEAGHTAEIKASLSDRYARLLELKGAALAGLSVLLRSTDESVSDERWRQANQAWDEALSATSAPLFAASIHRATARGFLERAKKRIGRVENLKDGLSHAEKAVQLATQAKDKPGGRLIRAKALYTLCVGLEMKYTDAGTTGASDLEADRLIGLTKEAAEELHALIPGTTPDRDMQSAAAVTKHERLRARQMSDQNARAREEGKPEPFPGVR